MDLWIDFETYSPDKDIKKVGTYAYAETAEIMLTTYAIDDGPVKLWDRTLDPVIPDELRWVFSHSKTRFIAHRAIFDRNILRESGLAPPNATNPKRWRCTMAKAMLHGFPGALEKVGEVLGLSEDQAKLKGGKKLISFFCSPAPRNHKADRYTRETHPEKWARFCEYAIRDPDAMREIDKRLPDWNWSDEEYHLDQKINDQGFFVDMELVKAGAVAATEEKIELFKKFIEITGGEPKKPTQRDKFREYLNEHFDLGLENTQKATFEALMEDPDLDETARTLMEISISANKTSTAKYATLLPAISTDGNFRGGLLFSGARRTRRWAGQVFQPQNLPSRGLPKQCEIETYIEALKVGIHDVLYEGELMHFGSAALRGVLIAPNRKKIVATDLANIEGRANAWLAGEKWKLKAFAEFDKGEGPDLYNVTAGGILGKEPDEVDKDAERNIFGKIPELALGYQGGVGAIQNFTKQFNVKMVDHWAAISSSVEPWCVDQAKENYEVWGRKRAGNTVSSDEWIASETIKVSWRDKHPAIEKFWHTCEKAAIKAINSPGLKVKAGKHLIFRYVRYQRHDYLLMEMPSKRYLVYSRPKIDDEEGITYYGVHPKTTQWSRLGIYGGKFVENACQSLSRDILMGNMIRADKKGFDIILTVHDEVVCEVPDNDNLSEKYLSRILAHQPEWAKGFPLAAKGFEAYRYRK